MNGASKNARGGDLVYGCVGKPVDWLVDAGLGSCRASWVGSVLGVQRQPFFSGVRCVAIDIKGAEWFFGKEPVLSLGLTHDMFLGFCVYASRRLVSRDR